MIHLVRSARVTSSRSIAKGLAFSVLCCTGLGGCVVAAVGGAAAGGGYVMGQERGASGTFSDTAIKAKIDSDWLSANNGIATYVDLNVFEGRVLLTGDVPNPQIRDQAVAIAWKVEGVKEVINEIQIADSSTLTSTAKDNWIQTRLRTELTFDSGIKSLNYSIETVNGVVYILGVARNQAELDLVTNHARNTPDVKRVVSYVRIRSGVGETPPPGQSAADPAPVGAGSRSTYAPASSLDLASPVPPPNPGPSAPIQIVPLK
jgi:osmotically-inducible protein OsmY